MARIDDIVDGIYRISTTVNLDGFDFSFDQFLIDDQRPALIHTGMHAMYDDVRDAVGQVLDPGNLEYGSSCTSSPTSVAGWTAFSRALRTRPWRAARRACS
jgi:hypothetical protein